MKESHSYQDVAVLPIKERNCTNGLTGYSLHVCPTLGKRLGQLDGS